MVQVIGVFYASAAECPVGLLVERSVAYIGPRFDSLVLLYFLGGNFLLFKFVYNMTSFVIFHLFSLMPV